MRKTGPSAFSRPSPVLGAGLDGVFSGTGLGARLGDGARLSRATRPWPRRWHPLSSMISGLSS
eukprot:8927209-Alexandrium_andersonii.AAC.1